MGSQSFLSKMVQYDPINAVTGEHAAPGVSKYQSVGSMNDPTLGASPQSGVASSLAAANQGYQVAPAGGSVNPTASQTYGMNSTPGSSGGTAVPTQPVAPTAQPTVTTGAATANPYGAALQTAMQKRAGSVYGQ